MFCAWRTASEGLRLALHDDVIKWKHFPRYWPFVRGIHRKPVNSAHKGQWRGAFSVSLICACINGWENKVRLLIWDAIAPIMASALWAIFFHGLFSFQNHNALLDWDMHTLKRCHFVRMARHKITAHIESSTSHMTNKSTVCSTSYFHITDPLWGESMDDQ